MTRSTFEPAFGDDDVSNELDCIDAMKEIIAGLRATPPWPKIRAAMMVRRVASQTGIRGMKLACLDFANAILDSECNGSAMEDILHDYAPAENTWRDAIQAAKMGKG